MEYSARIIFYGEVNQTWGLGSQNFAWQEDPPLESNSILFSRENSQNYCPLQLDVSQKMFESEISSCR